jgi:predicted P-loop ATPase
MHNARLAIAALGVDCSYDTFHNKMLFGFRDDAVRHEMQSIAGEITDNGIIRLRQLMSDSFGFDLEDKATRDAVKSLALEHCFDPVCDMLAEAEANWDGTERVDAMVVNYLNCKDTPLNRAISRKTMIAAVRRARRPGCKYDTITVLESKEGWNKSTAWRILAGDENFSDMSILGSRGREVQEQLAETWIHENADLAGMKKADIEIVKNFASRQSDDARPAYGHFLKKQKRHSIEVGTTNDSEYLLSPNGNRRFWPMEVVKMIDANAAAAAQEQRRVKDPWEDLLVDIPEWASVCDADGKEKERVQIIHYDHGNETECASSADLLTHVLKVLPARQTKSHSMQLANAMKANGWERPSGKVTIKGQRVRGYRRPWRRDPDVM